VSFLSGSRAEERRKHKETRQAAVIGLIRHDPFITDDSLAERLGVSVQTIRLDRLHLSIPEVRLRTKELAEEAQAKLRALEGQEVIGELMHLELGVSGVSRLETTNDMVFSKSQIVRGHYIFAQANSLAVALSEAERALTGAARIRYRKPVYVGQVLVARAAVTQKTPSGRYKVKVSTEVNGEEVFRGTFSVVSV
jgi:acyl-coenzyme A thioesterase PaaI-like protein